MLLFVFLILIHIKYYSPQFYFSQNNLVIDSIFICRPLSLVTPSLFVNLISDKERGVKTQTNSTKRTAIVKAIDALASLGADTVTTGSSLSATWRLLWTTEKEQLFIIEKAYLFGTQAGDVLQRVNFRFTSAVLRGENWEIPLPPFGQGWFDTVYLDDEIRVVKDIRGDYCVFQSILHTHLGFGFFVLTKGCAIVTLSIGESYLKERLLDMGGLNRVYEFLNPGAIATDAGDESNRCQALVARMTRMTNSEKWLIAPYNNRSM
ncbi:hypothetical protein CsatB_017210 [Cannabis sativa]